MKKFALSSLSLALLGAAGAVHAQSSVTLYGVLDDSIQYINNNDVNGSNKGSVALAAGNLQGDRWGLKGTEDLGGGLKAIFQLENGFNPNNGKLGQGSRLFGRQAFVGLQSDQAGTVTIGRQYDPVVDLVQAVTADNYWGSTFTTPSDVDNNDNSSRTNNAIKYTSNTYAGFQFEAMYAFGGVAGSTGQGQTWSGAATYANGPFSVAAGYIRMDNTGESTAARATAGWSATSDGTSLLTRSTMSPWAFFTSANRYAWNRCFFCCSGVAVRLAMGISQAMEYCAVPLAERNRNALVSNPKS